MKKTYLLTSLITLILVFTGCSEHPKTQTQEQANFKCRQDGQLAPQWTCIPQINNTTMIVGLGSAPSSKAGINFTRVNAMAQARNDLAFQIQTKVKAKVAQFVRSTGVKSNETVDVVSTQVSQQLAQVNLKGTKQLQSWQNPKNGTLFVLVGAPITSINQAVKDKISSSYKNNNALWQQFQSQNALKQLNKDFPTN